MTHRDIYTKFMIEYDKANVTSSYPSLTPYEVATLLDKAYLALIARKITGNNPRRSQLESDIKSVSDLEPLIKTVDLSLSHVNRNISNYTLPNDFLYYVSSNMVYDAGTNTADGIQYRLLPVTITTHNVAERFFASLYNMPWVKNPVCYIEGGKAYLVYDPVDTPWTEGNNVASLTYIKSPAKFAGSSTFDPSNPPTYEPDPIDDEEYEDPTNPTGGGQGQGLGQGQGGQENPPTTDAYAISLSSLTKIEDNKYKCLATVTKNNVPIENPSVTWIADGLNIINYIEIQPNGTECIIIVKKQLPSNIFYIKAISNGKTGSQLITDNVTYITSQEGNQGMGDTQDQQGGHGGDQDPQGGTQDPTGGQTITGRESIIVFDFLKPWNLNPSINVPQKPSPNIVEVMVTDKIFTNGPVLVYGVLAPDNQSPGDGCSIRNLSKTDTYSYAVKAHSGINVKCSSGYYLKSIEFLGSAGEFHPYDSQGGFSTVNNIWKTNSQNITEMKFKTFRLPAYWWLIRVHVVNTGSGQAVDQSPERAYLDSLGQTSQAAFFKLTYNNYLKQRCTSSQKAVVLKKETAPSKNGPWTRTNISADDQYDYKFIDDFGGEFLEYEMLGSGHWVRYVICRDSAWYGGYDIDLATTEAKYVPAQGQSYDNQYVAPLQWFHNRNYITNNSDGSVTIEAEFAVSNRSEIIGPYSKYEIENGAEYVTCEYIPATGYTDPEVLGDKESLAIKIIPIVEGEHTITVRTICSVDPSVSETVEVTVKKL